MRQKKVAIPGAVLACPRDGASGLLPHHRGACLRRSMLLGLEDRLWIEVDLEFHDLSGEGGQRRVFVGDRRALVTADVEGLVEAVVEGHRARDGALGNAAAI